MHPNLRNDRCKQIDTPQMEATEFKNSNFNYILRGYRFCLKMYSF